MTLSPHGRGHGQPHALPVYDGDKRQSHVIDSDEPVALGGEGRAPGPQDLMLAAFNACMTAAFVQEAISAGITLTHLDIETRGELLTGMPLICKKKTLMPLLAGCSMPFTSAGKGRPINSNASISRSLKPPLTVGYWLRT